MRAPRGRGSVFEDKSRGRWVAQIKLEGNLLRRYARTQNEAWELREQLVSDTKRQKPSDQHTLLREYLEQWLATKRAAPSTLRNYRSQLRLYIAPAAIAQVQLSKLAPHHLRVLLAAMEKQGLAASTIRQTKAILQAALRQALEDGLVTRNVAALVQPPPLARSSRRALTPDEARTLLESLRGDRLEAMYATAVMLGLRQGEVLGLRWQDIDLEAHTLNVAQTLQRSEGKYITRPPKTKTSTRALPMPRLLVSALSDWKVSQKAEFLKTGARPDHDLCFTTQGGNPLNGSWVTHDLQRRLKALGLAKFRFHDLRHAAATLLLAEGFGPREIMAVLGHSSIAVTMNVYAGTVDETLRTKMGRLDEWRAR
jgi:integrase